MKLSLYKLGQDHATEPSVNAVCFGVVTGSDRRSTDRRRCSRAGFLREEIVLSFGQNLRNFDLFHILQLFLLYF